MASAIWPGGTPMETDFLVQRMPDGHLAVPYPVYWSGIGVHIPGEGGHV